MVEEFRPFVGSDRERDPYSSFPELNAQTVYEHNLNVLVIHQEMIQGFFASIPHKSCEAGTQEDILCVVAINYYVSKLLYILKVVLTMLIWLKKKFTCRRECEKKLPGVIY